MESHGLAGAVHISAASRSLITNPSKYLITERGEITVKGKGLMEVRRSPVSGELGAGADDLRDVLYGIPDATCPGHVRAQGWHLFTASVNTPVDPYCM
jgi:hypothetical protein